MCIFKVGDWTVHIAISQGAIRQRSGRSRSAETRSWIEACSNDAEGAPCHRASQARFLSVPVMVQEQLNASVDPS